MKTILCPTDFSGHSENAIRYAIEMNKKLNAKIILLHVFETPMLYSDEATFTAQYDYEIVHEVAVNKLRAFHKKFFGNSKTPNPKVEFILQQGLASTRICEIATEKKADVIIMGTTGTSAAERLILGSNASRVIKNAPCMVLLIPPGAKYDGLSKVVYATDLNDDNLNHVKGIIPLAKAFNAELLFLYVNNSYMDKDESDLKKVTDKVKKIISYPKQSGFICTDKSISDGIDYFLKNNKADCVAMYTHHRNLFQNFYQSSISKKVSKNITVPLLVIHEKDYSFQDNLN